MDELELESAFTEDVQQEPFEAELATVKSIKADGLELVFDGLSESDGKVYPCNACVEFRVGDRVKVKKISGTYVAEYPLGAPGSRGSDGGGGGSFLPDGGAAGYVLGKKTAANGDVEWKAIFPTGGSTGYVLGKKSTSDGDVEWKAIFPTGGTDGQVLMKDGSTAQKVKWGAIPSADVSQLTTGNYNATLDTSGNLVPKSTTYRGSVGTSSVPWNGLYSVGTLSLGNSASKLGFFGTTPASKITLSTTSNNQGFTTVTRNNYTTTGVYVLNNIVGILKAYGLIG